MKLDTSSSLLEDCKQCPSPNYDSRPKGCEISLIVIHSISLPPGEYGGHFIEQFFQNKLDKNAHPYFQEILEMQVSAHALIKRDGEIIQFVPFNERAWHAGQSCYNGRERCNDFSIGIELEGTDTGNFEEAQYRQLSEIIAVLQSNYPKITNNITGHSDIAPGRKKDPGTGFEWNKLKQHLAK